jgi:hypothetical protein
MPPNCWPLVADDAADVALSPLPPPPPPIMPE